MKRIIIAVLLAASPLAWAQNDFGRSTSAGGWLQEMEGNYLPQPVRNQCEGWFSFSYNTTPVQDVSGNGNTGTVVGATWTDRSMSFDGLNDYVRWDPVAADIGGSSGTIILSLWTSYANNNGVPSPSATNKFLDSRNAANQNGRILFGIDNGNKLFAQVYDNAGAATLSVADSTTDWAASNIVVLATTWDYRVDQMYLYVNGIRTASDTTGGTAYDRTAVAFDCQLGSRTANIGLGQYFSGRMMAVMVADRALASNAVYNLRNFGRPR